MKTRSEPDLTMPVALAAGIPLVLFRLGIVFVRMKVKRRRGVRAFRKALIRTGMERGFANQLADVYASYGRLRSYLPRDGGLGFLPFRF